MTSTRSWTAGLAVSAALSVLMGPVPGPATAAAESRVAAAALIEAVSHDRYLSPSGDGRHERARFGFRLSKEARVAAIVRRTDGKAVRKAVLGRLDGGRHQWSWGGRNASGRVVDDGDYTVTLRATSGQRVDKVQMSTTLLTSLAPGRLLLSRLQLYPHATAVKDRLQAVYIRDGFKQIVYENQDFFEVEAPEDLRALRTRLVIRDPSGMRVFDRTRWGYRPAFEWTARAADGTPLPAGRYAIRFTVRDPAGNQATIRRAAQVSSAQLTEKVWTATTTAAATAEGPPPVYPMCNDCGNVCAPVPSDRYEGGLSFRPCGLGVGYAAVGSYGATPPVVPAPVDSYRLTASGGPTTPGAPDVGHFAGLTMGPGDVTVSTEWRSVALTRYGFVPEGTQPVTWGFGTSDGNSYDLATMTVEYRYYVPVP